MFARLRRQACAQQLALPRNIRLPVRSCQQRTKKSASRREAVAGDSKNELIVNVALQRQQEYALAHHQTIGGELARLAYIYRIIRFYSRVGLVS